MKHPTPAATVAIVLASLVALGCRNKPVTYQSRVRVQRAVVVTSDEQKKPLTADVTFLWADCPGEQRQTVRSGKELAACVPKLRAGEIVPVTVIWEQEAHGGYDWHVTEIAGCPVPPVDDDDSSFEAVQDCHPSIQHDAVLGFHCDPRAQGRAHRKVPLVPA